MATRRSLKKVKGTSKKSKKKGPAKRRPSKSKAVRVRTKKSGPTLKTTITLRGQLKQTVDRARDLLVGNKSKIGDKVFAFVEPDGKPDKYGFRLGQPFGTQAGNWKQVYEALTAKGFQYSFDGKLKHNNPVKVTLVYTKQTRRKKTGK